MKGIRRVEPVLPAQPSKDDLQRRPKMTDPPVDTVELSSEALRLQDIQQHFPVGSEITVEGTVGIIEEHLYMLENSVHPVQLVVAFPNAADRERVLVGVIEDDTGYRTELLHATS